jgi:hypothetical protein
VVQLGSAGCAIEVDSSPDGVTWTPFLAGDCEIPFVTSSGVRGNQYVINGGFVRVNVTKLSGSAGPVGLETTLKLFPSPF